MVAFSFPSGAKCFKPGIAIAEHDVSTPERFIPAHNHIGINDCLAWRLRVHHSAENAQKTRANTMGAFKQTLTELRSYNSLSYIEEICIIV